MVGSLWSYLQLIIIFVWFGSSLTTAQSRSQFGMPNPNSPSQIKDFEEMIGRCKCQSTKLSAEGNWGDTLSLVWEFRYILEGYAIQDITWKADSIYNTSIRQYHVDSAHWVVSFFSSVNVSHQVPIWKGNRVNDSIVLTRRQPSPTGSPGYSRLTFFNINETGFDWLGEWVSRDGNTVFPFWKIFCQKTEDG